MEKLMYRFLQELVENEKRMINGVSIKILNSEDLDVSKEVYGKLILRLENEKLIECIYARKRGIPGLVTEAEITPAGRAYLKSNSKLGKVYNAAKEIKSFIK